MPLPQFLRYRLARRGIIQGEDADKGQEAPLTVEEEVIAEDYDTPRKGGSTDDDVADFLDAEFKAQGHPGCPNKYNIYHVCNNFCKETWGSGHADPDPKYLRLKQKMLSKYPLPLSWTEMYDPGTGRFYYWDYESDYVSWLPPMHPRAAISEPAALLRQTAVPSKETAADADRDREGEGPEGADGVEEVTMERPERHKDDKERKREAEKRRDWHDDNRRRESSDRSKSKIRKRDSDDDDGKPPRLKDDKERKRPDDRHREEKERRGKGWKGGSGGGSDGVLDPMDPAAYSDAPRGTWSSGLERKNEAKTGADTTAAGPLYQMRPYPSPGDVLRANSKTSEPRTEPRIEPQHREESHSKAGKNRRV